MNTLYDQIIPFRDQMSKLMENFGALLIKDVSFSFIFVSGSFKRTNDFVRDLGILYFGSRQGRIMGLGGPDYKMPGGPLCNAKRTS
jgi:hypothetical protein